MTFWATAAMLSNAMTAKSLNIGIIYGGISEQKAGMDHYLHQVLLTMKRMAPDHRYVLIDHRRQKTPFKEKFEQVVLDLPRSPMRVTRWNLQIVPNVLSQFDLVFSPGLYGPVRIPKGVASVMVVHDLTRYLFPYFFPFNPTQKLLDLLAYPAMLRRYDHLLTVSRATRQDLMTRFKVPEEKITVAYHGAEEAFQPQGTPTVEESLWKSHKLKKPFILFLGTLEPRKNIPTLLKAFAGILDRIPHDLVLVGQKGWKWEPIFQEINRLDLKSRVHWTGYVSDLDRVVFYNAADFMVFPSWYEGFGMPLLEAMQCGCPVITSRVSAMPEVVGEAGLLIDPGRIEELQTAMLRLVQEPGLAEKLRKAGLEQARKFSWETSARLTLEVFEKIYLAQSSKLKAQR
ncbi:MAG: glycosyltransferase family 4 protein [Deltaproteobacteria bacterium]|nr:glycosyltransferase family 4 protein [Deltaproteobacteria bacterium]